jgi:hypothetical protein
MIEQVIWNPEYESYEAIHADGYIEPIRDSYDAEKLAKASGLEVVEKPTAEYFEKMRERAAMWNQLSPVESGRSNYATMTVLESLHALHPEKVQELERRLERARR